MDLITHDPGRYHVSLDTVWEFEEAILEDPRIHQLSSRETFFPTVPNIAWRVIYRSMLTVGNLKYADPIPPATSTQEDLFAVMMGPNFRKTMPQFLMPGRKSLYLFDAWPFNHEKIRLYALASRINHLFVSSSLGTALLSDLLPKTSCHWVPEGISLEDYHLAFTPEKDIDVLQLGRRYDRYHNMIVGPLEKMGKVYAYEKIRGQVIFPTRLDYVEGLARAKISICVPFSHTNPHRAGGIETMTVRYLQSMISKCLIVGHAPAEMVQLFGYNPVIQIDFNDPASQLRDLLDNLGDYQPLIEKNYRALIDHHTWRHRWKKIASILFDQPSEAPRPSGTIKSSPAL